MNNVTKMEPISAQEKEAARLLRERGWGLEPPMQYLCDMESSFISLWQKVKPYTMTSIERGYALYQSVRYLAEEGIRGPFIECGVWKGGSALLMALTLMMLEAEPRDLYLFDTFEGMPEPGEEDCIAYSGEPVRERWERNDFSHWAVGAPQVEQVIVSSGYDAGKVHCIKGMVEHTLPAMSSMEPPSLLRLDTDWYASTKVELELLYPRLAEGGVLLIDDYGHFTGARKAVDEYFLEQEISPLLLRVDYTGRVAIKR
jgi:O-methyltransferase